MALNREQKRRLRKTGDVDAEGEPVAQRTRAPAATAPARAKEERTGARQFLREVRQELRKVAWPTRSETINYSIIVLSTLVFMTFLIFAFDWAFSHFILNLYDV
jgi:preprotein translocase subunit SecE